MDQCRFRPSCFECQQLLYYKRNLIITVIVLIFLLHPMVTGVDFEIFQCVQVDGGDFRVYVDLYLK